MLQVPLEAMRESHGIVRPVFLERSPIRARARVAYTITEKLSRTIPRLLQLSVKEGCAYKAEYSHRTTPPTIPRKRGEFGLEFEPISTSACRDRVLPCRARARRGLYRTRC